MKLWRDAQDAVDTDDRVHYVVGKDRQLHRTDILQIENSTHTNTRTYTHVQQQTHFLGDENRQLHYTENCRIRHHCQLSVITGNTTGEPSYLW